MPTPLEIKALKGRFISSFSVRKQKDDEMRLQREWSFGRSPGALPQARNDQAPLALDMYPSLTRRARF